MTEVHDLLFGRRAAKTGLARVLREEAGLSRAEIAHGIGVTPGAVALWEAGKRRPTGEAAIRYGRLLRSLAEGAAA